MSVKASFQLCSENKQGISQPIPFVIGGKATSQENQKQYIV
jgi:hypothetical protein